MCHRFFERIVTACVLAVVGMSLGCGSPSAPTPRTSPAALAVTSISPNEGSPGGGTRVTISGFGFQPGSTVTFGGAGTNVTFVNSQYITATTPAMAAGPVDVVVINPGGQSSKLTGGYTYLAIPPPSVTAVAQNIGSTSGGAQVLITGTGFRSGAVVTLGGVTLQAYVDSSTTIYSTAQAHAAGKVDVVVKNPDGQFDTLTGGFTFVSPETFEVNGQWKGGADSNYEQPFQLTIQSNTLVSFSCGTSATITLSPQLPIRNGEFSFIGDDGVSISGRIVSPTLALGTIRIPGILFCVGEPWYAEKQ